MNLEEMLKLGAYYRRKHGLPEGVVYDPALHDNVPALAFGPTGYHNGMGGDGTPLRPEEDLFMAMKVGERGPYADEEED